MNISQHVETFGGASPHSGEHQLHLQRISVCNKTSGVSQFCVFCLMELRDEVETSRRAGNGIR